MRRTKKSNMAVRAREKKTRAGIIGGPYNLNQILRIYVASLLTERKFSKMNWYTCKELVLCCSSLLYSMPGSRLHPTGKTRLVLHLPIHVQIPTYTKICTSTRTEIHHTYTNQCTYTNCIGY